MAQIAENTMAEYDKSSKWLIQHHGDSILRLAQVRDIESWRALQAELVQPRQLPDGLIEARIRGQAEAHLFLVEVATYPERRLVEQVFGDVALAWLNRRVLPEVLVLVLHPKGKLQAVDSANLQSPLGWTQWHARWRVVELWTIPAEELLAAKEPGLVPWVPLAQITGPPDPIFQQCRDLIDRQTPTQDRANLLAVTQVLSKLRYNDPRLLTILGGRKTMIESPLIQELLAEQMHATILDALEVRFGPVPQDMAAAVQAIQEEQRLKELHKFAVGCADLSLFRARLQS